MAISGKPKKVKKLKNPHGVIVIDGKTYRLKSNGKPGVELTHAGNTITTAEFFTRILGFARKGTKYWPPAMACKLAARRKYVGTSKQQKWEFLCNRCKQWFPDSKMDIDHIAPLGGINGWDKIVDWYKRAYPEIEGYQMLCKPCHVIKTNSDKKK
jgi:hypothetical protein